MHVEVLIATQIEAHNICLGAKHIPLQEQTLIWSYFRLVWFNPLTGSVD